MEFYTYDQFFHNRNIKTCEKKLHSNTLIKRNIYTQCNPNEEDTDSDCETGRIRKNSKSSGKSYQKEYIITMFGKMKTGEDVAVHVRGYRPRFYVQVDPNNMTEFSRKFNNDLMTMRDITHKHRKGLINKVLVNKKIFYGFRNNEEFPFIKMEFSNSNSRRSYYYALRKRGYTILENNVEPYMRFYHDTGINPVSLIKVNKYVDLPIEERFTNCVYELSTHIDCIEPVENATLEGLKLRRLAFDIETVPAVSGFAHPELKLGDPIVTIGCSFNDIDYVLSLNKVEKTDEFKVIECKNETDLIIKFIELIRKRRPDVIYSYNGDIYDWNYIHKRAVRLGLENHFLRTNKFTNFKSRFEETRLSTSALGNNEFKYLYMPGIINIDIYKVFNKINDSALPDLKLESVSKYYLGKRIDLKGTLLNLCSVIVDVYKGKKERVKDSIIDKYLIKHKKILDDLFSGNTSDIMYMKSVSEFIKELSEEGAQKEDLPYKTMYKYYLDAKKDPDSDESKKKMYLICKYCIQDCRLLHKLMDKCNIMNSQISMANINIFPWKYILNRGVGILVYSVISYHTQEAGFIIPEMKMNPSEYIKNIIGDDPELNLQWNTNKKKFEEKIFEDYKCTGAMVFNPTFCKKENVATLDVNSMYPSIIISHNLSHEMFVLDSKYDNLPGVSYINVKWTTTNGKEYTSRIVHNFKDRKFIGILPLVLQKYIQKRKDVRTKQKGLDINSIQYNMLEAEQLSIKVLCNSIYGQTGTIISNLYLKAISGCTTAIGRDYILNAKNLIESKYTNAKIVYGDTDSVFVEFIPSENLSPEEQFKEVWNMASEAVTLCNNKTDSEFKQPMKIELEKIFSKITLFDQKKKYIGRMHKQPSLSTYEIKTMGVKFKKRDSTGIEKFLCRIVYDMFLEEKEHLILPFIERTVECIYANMFDITYFMKSGKYTPPYKNPKGVAHACVAEIIKEIDPGNTPLPNERIYYVYKWVPAILGPRGGRRDAKKCEQAYPVAYWKDNYKIDYKAYIKLCINNIKDILKLVLKDKSTDEFYYSLIDKYDSPVAHH